MKPVESVKNALMQEQAIPAHGRVTTRLAIDAEGFRVADGGGDAAAAHDSHDHLVWIGSSKTQGCWLVPEKAQAVACAIAQVVASHNARHGKVRAPGYPDSRHVMFKGRRDTAGEVRLDIVVDGVSRSLPYHLGLKCHSPDGFAWGNTGPGSAQLALAMCAELMPHDQALAYHHVVKDRLIATISHKDTNWRRLGSQVTETIQDFKISSALALHNGRAPQPLPPMFQLQASSARAAGLNGRHPIKGALNG